MLALYAPFGGNTPTEYLFKNADHDTDTLAVFENNSYDPEAFRQGVDVVVNLISDVDQAGAMLPLAAYLVERLGKPTINDPRKIQRTTRDMVAELLTGIRGCRIPKILRQQAGTELSVESLRAALPQATSILARPVGTHGGDDFDKIDGADELAAYLAKPAETDRYFIEYADYRSADGFFRKYRFIFVDGEVLPYHLAICDDWKVHHVNTDMANQEWMQDEEAAFLNDPTLVFNEGHYRALRDIQQRIGLEYFGIDCSVDTNGELWCSRSTPRCWCMTTTPNSPTRIRPSTASRRRSTRCWRGSPSPAADEEPARGVLQRKPHGEEPRKRRLEPWAANAWPILRDAAKTPLLRMRVFLRSSVARRAKRYAGPLVRPDEGLRSSEANLEFLA